MYSRNLMHRTSLLVALLTTGCLYNKSLYDERVGALTDADGDGYASADDCDDDDATAFPSADEVPADGIDQDCDGGDLCHADTDGDGFGSAALVASTDLDCDDDGESADTTDCDPADPDVFPDADEVFYDGVDQNCAPEDDDDADGDGFAAYDLDGTDCDDTDPDLHPGLDRTFEVPSTDYPTIQSAIDATCDGDTVHIAGGVYFESFDMGHRDIAVIGENSSIRGKDGDTGPVVRMSRGSLDTLWIEYHAGTENGGCIRVEHGKDVYIGAATSDCSTTKDGGGIYVSDTDGLSIQSHQNNHKASGNGGAIYIRDSANVHLEDIASSDNSAGGNGGAIYVENVDGLTFSNDSFGTNKAGGAGGALYLKDTTGIDSDLALFGDNSSVGFGSTAAIIGGSDGRIRAWAVLKSYGEGQAALYLQGRLDLGNLFVAQSDGAGIHVVPNPGDDVTLQNLSVLGNSSTGLVVHTDDANALSIVNSIIAYNGGYGLLSTGSELPSVSYSDLYANTVADYSGMSNLTGFNGNLHAAPGFLAYPSTNDFRASMLLLRPDSTLIDVGDPAILDPDGSRSDLGMIAGPDAILFEYYDDLDADTLYDGWESENGLDGSRDDTTEDPDLDGLTNLEEFALGTWANSNDSDDDGATDNVEVIANTDPLDDTKAPPSCTIQAFVGAAPTAFYALEDAGSSTLVDSAGTYDATPTGTVDKVSAQVGDGALFATGSASSTAPFSGAAFTWAGWVRLDSLSPEFQAVANHGTGPQSYTGWSLLLTTEGVPRLYTESLTEPNERLLDAPFALTLGQWTHLAVTFDAGYATLFVDGYAVSQYDVGYASIAQGDNPYTLAQDGNNGARNLVGALDEVGLWNVALSRADVAALAADGVCSLPSL